MGVQVNETLAGQILDQLVCYYLGLSGGGRGVADFTRNLDVTEPQVLATLEWLNSVGLVHHLHPHAPTPTISGFGAWSDTSGQETLPGFRAVYDEAFRLAQLRGTGMGYTHRLAAAVGKSVPEVLPYLRLMREMGLVGTPDGDEYAYVTYSPA